MSAAVGENGNKHLPRKSMGRTYRQTPYCRKTPKVRELTFQGGDSSRRTSVRSRALETQASFLTFKSWKTYKVSPLLNFCYKKEKLEEYARHLSSYIERENKKNVGVLINHNTKYKISISPVQGMNVSHADDKAISIKIAANNGNGHKNLLFNGMLLSVERNKDAWENRYDERMFTVLPLFLASGRQFFIKAVVKYLEADFSCIVQPLSFSSFQLMWLLAMWAGVKPEVGPKPLFMEYKLPLKSLHTIQYSISASSVYEIWCQIHDPESNEVDIEEVEAFVSSLERHFKTIFGIDLTYLQLTAIGTAAAAVHKNGITKLVNTSAAPYVLRYLTSLAQEPVIT